MGLDKAYAVILSGGRGERFWPLSTAAKPKQLLSLVGDRPMIAEAVDRLLPMIPTDRIFIITSANLVAPTREAVPEFPPENIIGEPFRRDTAAAAALGSVLTRARDPEGAVCIMTADHVIGTGDIFRNAIGDAFALALERDVLITIGIKPAFASTGFGYIEAGSESERVGETEFFKAERFVEKPDQDTAREYLEKGRFYWNSGMFVWSVKAFEAALARHCPALSEMNGKLLPAVGSGEFMDLVGEEYGRIEKISIDYALMEKADNIMMARGVFDWDDVGSWPALANHFKADSSDNIVVGRCETVDSSGNIVLSRDDLVALVGVDDLVVVKAPGAVLVCRKDRAQDVKKMVRLIEKKEEYGNLL